MRYRVLGKTKLKVSVLGFGCMRLPVIDGDESSIDEKQATEMLHYAIENGVNYIDTAYPYHGGNSEIFVGKALAGGYREQVLLATKLPSWFIRNRQDMDKYLDEQLKKLQTDYIDCYLVHSLGRGLWDNVKQHGVIDFLEEAKSKGKIRTVGFSFHDELKVFKEIVDAYEWDFCQIQYNYMDENYQAGREGLEYAAAKGLGIIVMEPLRGGKLAQGIPDEVQAVWDRASTKRAPAEWALRYVWDRPEVNLLLSGMNNLEQVKQNIAVASEATPNYLTYDEKELINQVREIYISRLKINCTNCKYCMPCPAGVNIPDNFNHFNNAYIYNDVAAAKRSYGFATARGGKATSCVECAKCEDACPQKIPIRDRLKEVAVIFEQ